MRKARLNKPVSTASAAVPVLTVDTLNNQTGIHAEISLDRDHDVNHNWTKLVKYRQYAKGEHTLQLTPRQREILKGILEEDFCDNVCHQILAEDADRLSLQGFTVDDTTVQELINNWFTKENIEDHSGEVHYSSGRDADHVAALGWDSTADGGKGRVAFYPENWWDGNEGVFIAYNGKGKKRYGVKEWFETGIGKRRNVWFEDRVEHYLQSDAGNWELYEQTVIEQDGDGNEVETVIPAVEQWVKKNGKPLHIPYIHFPNPGKGGRDYGDSEIGGGVLGFQDQINDLQFAMSGAGRMTAYQIITIAGIDLRKVKLEADGTEVPVTDAEGNQVMEEVEVDPGQVLSSLDPATVFGHIPAGDLSQLIDLYNQKLKSVARMTRTPLHAITGGDWPSGEALLRAELPAVGKATKKIKKFKSIWASVAHMVVEITNAFGTKTYSEDAILVTNFAEPERRDIVSKAAVVNLIKDLLSNQAALRMLGKTEDEIKQIMEEKAEAQQQAMDNAMKAFDAGTAPGTGLPGSGKSTAKAADNTNDKGATGGTSDKTTQFIN